MRIAAYVTIKLDSERVPHKNTRMVGSRPLCYHIIHTLLNAKNIDEVYVYCSDEEVKKYIPAEAVFVKRDKKLDGRAVKAKEIYDAFIREVDADVYVAACTTSPFTKVETVENAVDKVRSGEYDSAFTARKIQTFSWYQGKPVNYKLDDIPKTQDLEPVYVETSAFFCFRKNIWTEHGRRIGFKPYIQEVDEIEAIDIDTMEDYNFACAIAEKLYRI